MTAPHHVLPEGAEPPPPGVGTMAIVRWALVVAMAALAAFSLLDAAGVLHSAAARESAVQWYCPMHPSVVQDHPGECPICSMTLVPREVGATPAPEPPSSVPGLSHVQLSPERVQLVGLRTAPVRRAPLAPTVRTTGWVTPSEERLAKIQPRFSGWIEKLVVAQTGQAVRRGDVLATVYSPEVLTAQQEFLSARRWARRRAGEAETPLTAGLDGDARRRLELLGIAPEEIAALERGGKPLAALPLRSPVDGSVMTKTAVQGAWVEPSTDLFTIADLSVVWVLADVYERDLARVAVGQPATLTLAAYPAEPRAGRVEFVPPVVSPDTRTARVRVAFENADGRLRPGMYGDVTLTLPGAEALVVPAEALVDTGELQYVFVAHDGGHFEPRRVVAGPHAGDDVAVLDGLAEGETVVTTGNFLLDSESRLRAAITGTGTTAGGGAATGAAPAHRH